MLAAASLAALIFGAALALLAATVPVLATGIMVVFTIACVWNVVRGMFRRPPTA